jgi:hypothetical protein
VNASDKLLPGSKNFTPEEETILKRTLHRFLVAVATFLIGTTTHWFYDRHEEAALLPQTEWVRVDYQNRNESPEQPPPSKPKVVFDYDPTEFNPRGDYFIIGRKPKGFREFDCLELAVDEGYDGKASGRVLFSTYDGAQYGGTDDVSGLVTKQRMSLVAKPVYEEEVGYRFEGEFLRKGDLWRAGRSRAVLKGRLSKIQGGKTIAEAVVKFRIEYLGC